MRPILFIMSLSGSAVVLMYYFLRRYLSLKIRARWRQLILRLAIVFYLIPFPCGVFYIKSLIMDVIPAWKMHYIELHKGFTISIGINGTFMITKAEKIYDIFFIICLIVTIGVTGFLAWRYIRVRIVFERYSYIASASELQRLENLKQKIGLNKQVRLAFSKYIMQPLTIGFLKPLIILPEDISSDAKEKILLHELAHLKHHDIFWNILGLIVIALHWFNPICYIMKYYLAEIDEISSDENVTAGFSNPDKIYYCELIIQMSEKSKSKIFGNQVLFFAIRRKQQIKRRIDEVMKKKSFMNKMYEKGVCAAVFLSALSIGFIYTPPKVVYAGEYLSHDKCDFDIITFDESEGIVTMLELDSEDFFVSSTGVIIDLTQKNMKAVCDHEYVSGVRKKHIKNSDGGCILEYYDAIACTKCGKVIKSELFKTESYTKCPH